MSGIHDTNDPVRVIRELERRVRDLERANALNHSSITGGTGMAIKIDAGIHIEDEGSLAADQLRIDRAEGGSVRTPGRFEGGYLKSAGDINADGTVRGYTSVMAPIDGTMQSLGPRIGLADARASAAQTAANTADSKAGTAQNRADDAYSLASTRASQADHIELANAFYIQVARINALDSQLDALTASYESHLNEFHGGWNG